MTEMASQYFIWLPRASGSAKTQQGGSLTRGTWMKASCSADDGHSVNA
jgi:hypothetical protein